MESIKKYSRDLHSLAVDNDISSFSQDLTDLVVSYSTNLDALDTLRVGRGLSLEQYQEIASKCTEVDCSVECDIKEDSKIAW